jgi:metal-responsive CopG/Arc/MetJ family transcriptional regulator
MSKRPRNDHAIFFRLPTALVEQIDAATYDLRSKRTGFIRQAIFRALDHFRDRQVQDR